MQLKFTILTCNFVFHLTKTRLKYCEILISFQTLFIPTIIFLVFVIRFENGIFNCKTWHIQTLLDWNRLYIFPFFNISYFWYYSRNKLPTSHCQHEISFCLKGEGEGCSNLSNMLGRGILIHFYTFHQLVKLVWSDKNFHVNVAPTFHVSFLRCQNENSI